jgi:hypothetical protein
MGRPSVKHKLRPIDRPYILAIVMVVTILIRIWLINGIPKQLIYGPHDDLYYAKMAHYLINGEWMGPYNQMTLIKGPFYGFFLVFSFLSGMPLFLNETLFYILACISMFYAISPLIKNPWWRYLFFVTMLFIPASLTTSFNLRVYREFVYFSLTLFVVVFALGLFLRLEKGYSPLIFWSVGLGISMGAFLLTREEGSWIYPMMGLLLLGGVVMVWKRNIEKKWYRIILILLPIFIWFIPILIVSSINYKYYKFWGTSELLDKDFNRVINTLGRIKTKDWYPFSPINNESVDNAAGVSPKFAELTSSINESSKAFQSYIDSYMTQQSSWFYEKYYVNGAAVGSHFVWMFRDVLASKGYYDKGVYPREQLVALADELETACEINSLDCMPFINIPTVTSLKQEHLPIIMKFFHENILYILKLHSDITGFPTLDLRTWPSYVNEFNYFDEFTYNPMDSRLQGYSGDDLWIDNNLDIRYKTIEVKETALQIILKTYQLFTLPIMILMGLSWLIFVIYCAVNKCKIFSFQYFAVFLFLIGLLITRVMLLSIINATSSIIGRYYAASCYIFLYLFVLISLFALISKLKTVFRKEIVDKKTIEAK